MEIVRDDAQLERYIREAVHVSGDSPVLLDSYLSGAELHQNILLPRTHKAWERITESWAAKDVLRFLKITLREPPYFNAAHNVQLARAA